MFNFLSLLRIWLWFLILINVKQGSHESHYLTTSVFETRGLRTKIMMGQD